MSLKKLISTFAFALYLISAVAQTESAIAQTPPPEKKSSKTNAFNPDISVNFLGLAQKGTDLSNNRNSADRNGLLLQEAELQLTSDVDPYHRASALFAIAQEDGNPGYVIEPEEVFFESISLPGVTLRVGKFKLALGKHNQLHAHAYAFLDSPLIHGTLLGEEGLNDSAVSAAVLLPTSWYSEVILQAFGLSNEGMFNYPSSGEMGALARLKNLWDLSEDSTLELGISNASGRNQFDGMASVSGADLTYKWRPSDGGKYKAFIWSTEYLNGYRPGLIDASTGEPTEWLSGAATWVQYQFAQRWWIQLRGEYQGITRAESVPFQTKQSFLVGFFPSEFSGFRLQFDKGRAQDVDHDIQKVALQYNISVGAHPAHTY